MKKFLFSALILATSIVNAAEVTVLDTEVPLLQTFDTFVDTRFHMDQTSGEGFVKVTVSENRIEYNGGYYDHMGRWYPTRTTVPVVVFQETVKVDGLNLIEDQVIFQAEEGEVNCGKMGVSRIFKKPTIYLNGNCKLSGKITGKWERSRVVVKLKTK